MNAQRKTQRDMAVSDKTAERLNRKYGDLYTGGETLEEIRLLANKFKHRNCGENCGMPNDTNCKKCGYDDPENDAEQGL